MKFHSMADAARLPSMSIAELRDAFLVRELFKDGAINLVNTDLDRAVIGAAVPTRSSVRLDCPPALKAEYFLERRELGVLNLGGDGLIRVDGSQYPMASRDALYVGRGTA